MSRPLSMHVPLLCGLATMPSHQDLADGMQTARLRPARFYGRCVSLHGEYRATAPPPLPTGHVSRQVRRAHERATEFASTEVAGDNRRHTRRVVARVALRLDRQARCAGCDAGVCEGVTTEHADAGDEPRCAT